MVAKPTPADWLALGEAFQKSQSQPVLQRYRRRKWERLVEFEGWIQDTVLPTLSIDQALGMYLAAGGIRRREFMENSIEDIRDALDFLLYDTVTLEGRFQECAAEDGGFRLAGAGKELVSYLLCVKDPTLFAVWNSSTEKCFRKLGMPLAKGPLGVGYIDVLEGSWLIRRNLGLPDFRAVDEFSYSFTRPAAKGGN